MANDNLARKQIYIPATKPESEITLRVAAYCRVSTDSDDQRNSFAAQNTHYSELILSHDRWEMVDIYADAGITGTSARKRPDFQRMLADCRKGKIDKILVKSISRFARNTTDCLETIRELKALGISIYFEEHNIDTKDVASEMLTAVLASCAQAESESISKNLRWSVQKRMESGQYNTCRAPYGYRLENNGLVIHEEEAETVKSIFAAYLNGVSPRQITEDLNRQDPQGKRWDRQTIEYILKNERYAGNAVLRKRYTTDTLPYRIQYNKGEKEMYFVEGSNPPIISQEEFEQVQALRESRSHAASGNTERFFARKLVCGCCGSLLRSKRVNGIWYWVCRTHEQSIKDCPLMPIPEKAIEAAFCRLTYNLCHHSEIISYLVKMDVKIREKQMLWSPGVIELNRQISDISNQSHQLALLNRQGMIDPDIFISKSNRLAEQLRDAKQQKERLLARENDRFLEETRNLLETLSASSDETEEFDEELFCEMIDKVMIQSNTNVRFRMKNGLELPEAIERTVR